MPAEKTAVFIFLYSFSVPFSRTAWNGTAFWGKYGGFPCTLPPCEVESAGRVIHAVSDYFSEGAEPEDLSKNERTVFNRIRRDIDKSFSDYEASVTYGKQGAELAYLP